MDESIKQNSDKKFCKFVTVMNPQIYNLELYATSLLEYELSEPVTDELSDIKEKIMYYTNNNEFNNCKEEFLEAIELIIHIQDCIAEILMVTSNLITKVNKSEDKDEWYKITGIKPIPKEFEQSGPDFKNVIQEMDNITEKLLEDYFDQIPSEDLE